ncbi:hypothetical protein GCM10009636_24520 [Arthrobacter koreensis]|uniref:DEAD/DEAH box helicase n=1 Tax=Arthrobacter koreensis TaxID=199136 RepID=UPI001264DE15|nr:DEAD/DEAH box helicase [Arthrobacter koreensis]
MDGISTSQWQSVESELAKFVLNDSRKALESFRVRPELVREQGNIEQATVQGGYGRKQLNELIQNAADAMDGLEGRIRVVLTADALYCANEGMPFQRSGYAALLLSHSSSKRDDQIGRFGLGFKSVLQITDTPHIFSRTASVRWDKAQSESVLAEIAPGLSDYPVLRLATPVDPFEAAAKDALLADLMTWASTVVKLPLKPNITWLSEELKDFPPEFLLFSDQIGRLEFDDEREATSTHWTATRAGSRVTLSDGSDSSEWRVFTAKHVFSETAKSDAGSIVARDDAKVVWAVPMAGKARQNLGSFWNYFPTTSQTTLRGIVNAPFKMNEDRHNMLRSEYNREILTRTLPRMVAGALPELSPADDPASFLDLFPARGREARSWADEVINLPVMQAVAAVPSLPDRMGRLQSAATLHVPPALEEATRLEEKWNAAVGRDRPWVHESALNSRTRSAQVNRILELNRTKRTSVTVWLEEVVADGSLDSIEKALEIAVEIDKRHPGLQEEMRRSRVVLAADGEMRPLITRDLFLPLSAHETEPKFVANALYEHGHVADYLRILGFQALNAQGRIVRIAREVSEDYDSAETAESLWRMSRSLQVPETLQILRENTDTERLLVKCKNGMWKPLRLVWLPGALIPAGSPGDEHLLVDELFHRPDLRLLQNLGARTNIGAPSMQHAGVLYETWKSQLSRQISQASASGPEPVSPASLKFPPALCTEGLELLADASFATRAKVTERLLSNEQYPVSVQYGSIVRTSESVDGPDLWWIRNFGVLKTPLGLVDVKYCVGQLPGFPEMFLPYPGDIAQTLNLPTDPRAAQWTFVLPAAESKLTLSQVHQLYGCMARAGLKAPKELLVPFKNGTTRHLTSHVILAADEASFTFLRSRPNVACVYTGNDELDASLSQMWGLNRVSVSSRTSLEHLPDADKEPISLGKLFPQIHRVVSGARSGMLAVPCSELRTVVSNDFDETRIITDHKSRIEDGVFYYSSSLQPRNVLAALLESLGSRLSAHEVASRLKKLEEERKRLEREQKVRAKDTEAGRFVALVGRQKLMNLLPAELIQLAENRGLILTDDLLFAIMQTLHGSNLLKVTKSLVDDEVVDPEQFRGSRDEKEFLEDLLGFSFDQSDSVKRRKPEREEVTGPVRLSPLHDYQSSVLDKVLRLLDGRSGKKRGILQLPTGAGKTRVAVESAIRDVEKSDGKRVIVWIAQTEELCEQAVETWMYVWQAAGPAGKRMAVSRLWGGNKAAPEETKLHLVVATIQTLASIQENRRLTYDWMSRPDLVIIDEAHAATTPSYTRVLSWFGRSYTDNSNLLLGLSATPYRGANEAETKRLVNRFGGNLIVPEQFDSDDAHNYLQHMGVLASVKHVELEGIKIQLKDMASVHNSDEQSSMLEARLDLNQVAQSQTRNNVILDHIKSRGKDGTTLVFAASVAHAEALAAVLSLEGLPAAAISSKTDAAHRRRLIEDFRKGRIKVLTNFDVLSQGFDAPKVDAVYVCRPTFSPNKYIQMVGRGLRGPKNGGSEKVLIVNVRDNLEQYGEKLAFTEFDYLWNAGTVSAH